MSTKPRVEIEYCTGCRWLMRAAWTAQEFLSTFEQELGEVALQPSEEGGVFRIRINGRLLFCRKDNGGFADMKVLKQLLRDVIAPERDLGHSDRQPEEDATAPETNDSRS